jgi:arylsulfatase A-like enzyme
MVGPDVAVFLYSDNGTSRHALAPGGDASKAKTTTFDGGVRVLCLARWQGCQVGELSGLQHVQDIAAGVCAVAGVAAPVEWDAQTTPRTYILSETPTDRACRTLTHKLRQVDGLEELYWLEVDPTESSPLDLLAPENQAVLAYLRGKLDAAAI